MKIAVCIPTYNRASTIRAAIDSLLSQTKSAFDVIVFDNCSTDATSDIVSSYESNSLKYIRNSENLGFVGNINKCFAEHVNYDWIGILHSDDVHCGESVFEVIRLISENPTVGLIFSDVNLINADGIIYQKGNSSFEFYPRGESALRVTGGALFCSTIFYKSSVLKAVEGYSGLYPYSADEDHNNRIALSHDIVRSGVVLASYRRHGENLFQETWCRPDFIANYESMRIGMIKRIYGNECLDQINNERHRLAIKFLYCAFVLKLSGKNESARNFRNYTKMYLMGSPWRFKLYLVYIILDCRVVGEATSRVIKGVKRLRSFMRYS